MASRLPPLLGAKDRVIDGADSRVLASEGTDFRTVEEPQSPGRLRTGQAHFGFGFQPREGAAVCLPPAGAGGIVPS